MMKRPPMMKRKMSSPCRKRGGADEDARRSIRRGVRKQTGEAFAADPRRHGGRRGHVTPRTGNDRPRQLRKRRPLRARLAGTVNRNERDRQARIFVVGVA